MLDKVARKKTIKGEIVEQYLKDHPDEFKKTLAKRIVNERPDVFKDVEMARALIRHYTGARGASSRKTKKGQPNPHLQNVMQKYYLRAEENVNSHDFILPEKRVGIISDLHIPYHVEDSIQIALEHIDKQGMDALLINGDLVDFYQISRWSKDPTRATMQYEVDMTQEFFEMITNALPGVKIYYKIGNHEERFEQYMQNKAKELMGIDEFTFDSMMGLEYFNITKIGGKQKIKLGKLNVLHGHETGRSFFNPVNPARGQFLRAKASTLAGHNHQSSEHHENNINGDAIACWSTGCLCDMRPEYYSTAYTRWNHGAAHVEVDSDGAFNVDNFRIINGKVR